MARTQNGPAKGTLCGQSKMPRIAVGFHPEIFKTLSEMAHAKGQPVAALIRHAVRRMLAEAGRVD